MKILPITQAENKYKYKYNIRTNLPMQNVQKNNFDMSYYYPVNFRAKKVNIA